MREEYDCSNSLKNLYAQKEKKQISISKKAFGILKGKIKDPVAWQREIRDIDKTLLRK
jgi:hypothetical protein